MKDQQQIHQLALELRNCGSHFAVAITGGAAPVCSSLFVHNGEGGGSTFMLDLQAPWGTEASDRLYLRGFYSRDTKSINQPADMPSAVSKEKVIGMAQGMFILNNCMDKSYRPKYNLWGVAISAKLSYLNERAGREHEAYICAYQPGKTYTWLQKFSPDYNRIDQELACSEAVIRVMRYVAGVDGDPRYTNLELTRLPDQVETQILN